MWWLYFVGTAILALAVQWYLLHQSNDRLWRMMEIQSKRLDNIGAMITWMAIDRWPQYEEQLKATLPKDEVKE